MGVDIHLFNFLRYSKNFGAFKQTLTLGRQAIHTDINFILKKIENSDSYVHDHYCESLLKNSFGSTSVDSIDNSNYESSTIISDLNLPIPETLHNSFDTVIDGGCIEHIFNAPMALLNASKMVRNGGQIIHALPANNFCGHGFWQFSPELFFSLYNENNGYIDTEVFLADLSNINSWIKVSPPHNGDRVNFYSSGPAYVLVRTVKNKSVIEFSNIQQSDYIKSWDDGKLSINSKPSSHYLNEISLSFLS